MEKQQIQRRVIRSISEWSIFKYVLISYLIFFVLFVILFAIIALISWAGLAASGLTISNVLSMMGLDNMLQMYGVNLESIAIGTGSVVGIILFLVFGLLFSIVYAAVAVLWTWILNVILKISGGIEVRYSVTKQEAKAQESIKSSEQETGTAV